MEIADVFVDLPVLETERTLLRKLRKEDEVDMFYYGSNPEVCQYTVWNTHKYIEDTREFINRVMDKYLNQQVAPWGIEDKQTGKFVGTCGFIYWDTHNAKAELGYAISRDYWNKGYMSEVVSTIIDFGFKNMNLVRVEARCHPEIQDHSE